MPSSLKVSEVQVERKPYEADLSVRVCVDIVVDQWSASHSYEKVIKLERYEPENSHCNVKHYGEIYEMVISPWHFNPDEYNGA